MLTKDLIARIDKVRLSANGGMPDLMIEDERRELRRLALLGLERDERAERIGRAVIDALVPFAHPAYGPVETLRGMATILRKPHHGPFDQTPAFLDAIADAMEEP